MFDFIDFIIKPIEFIVSYIFYGIHFAVSLLFGDGPGISWVMSIIFLTIVIRICIFPIFLKSIKSTRKMQALAPEMKKIQNKYKGKNDQESKQAKAKETMELYQEHGANPVGGCLPLLIQSPFFIALWRMLSSVKDIADGHKDVIGPISRELASEIESSSFFGIRLSDTLNTVDGLSGHIVIICMIAIMCSVMFISQRLVMIKNMPQAAKEGPQFKMQKSMVYIFPFMYIFSGVMFPVGLLLYMMTTNLFTLGQGIWQLEFMPTPGSDAAEKRELKLKKIEENRKEELKVSDPEKYNEIYGIPDAPKQQRVQPQKSKQKKSTKKKN